ncbi:alpha-amylase [Marinobacter nanhaiticus D15-8W]|uniref:Alpha-amylase n=1 Tax=Marinobacter nanhaiticus D15-8W TaxID=626887 RepID=N6VU70_9GAMM|nr:alpha-amylase [Marinobacter nanhaiticus]ENO13680.1 alpha-amylase [Marinobacter nanhaiticus D15-8W]BES71052.1 alpha-amylase [Marinobacter nanhaiticus D15-8W]
MRSPLRPALTSLCALLVGCAGPTSQGTGPLNRTDGNMVSDKVCTVSAEPERIPVGDVFADGEWVRDFYSGRKVQVEDGHVTLAAAPGSEGLIMLESVEAEPGSFKWAGATVYFVITDRFANGKAGNDNAYGRKRDGKEEIGTFHGGDFVGLTEKLDYLEQLGVNAIWVSPPVEQIHGWVGGGDQGDFRHYGYHGYYALDFTRLDAAYGTEAEFQALVDEAHERGIRVVMDIVMNHPGYSTLQDMQTFNFGGLFEGFEQYLPERWGDWRPESWENLHAYHALINYDHPDWSRWWGGDWVRAGIADYPDAPSVTLDPVKGSLSFLPDFRTASDEPVDLPVFLAGKDDTRAKQLENATVRDYLIQWHTDWIRRFGIDGFRVDTVKHVEPEAWAELKVAAQEALDEYRSAHPGADLPAKDFWMVGEVFPHSVSRSQYYDAGFDAVINFDLQEEALSGAECLPNMEPVYADYSDAMHGEERFNVMSYISSHDTRLFSSEADEDPALQKRVAAALLFTPGTVQVFYGDESGRKDGPNGSDAHQGTRSDMNWAELDDDETAETLRYWQTMGQFRENHPAIGAGRHALLSEAPYTFARQTRTDRVVIAFARK